MSRSMKKWQGFYALETTHEYIANEKYNKNKIDKVEHSEEKIQEINEIIQQSFMQNTRCKFTYYKDGYTYEQRGVVQKIDVLNQYLKINGEKIEFANIVDVYIL